jgi:WhiB family transcriptional regulator, redox-sensing transcriptional regulator
MPDFARSQFYDDEVGHIGLLLELLVPPAWHAQGSCRSAPASISWFPEQTSLSEAKRVCASCPVREECLEWALAQDSYLVGIWGGTSQRERHRLRAERVA